MQIIKNQNHSKETYYLALSKMLERAGFYGIRATVVLYMTDKLLNMTSKEALEVYGWFSFALILGEIIGAITGDLAIGNKKAIVIGAILQAIGAFSLCIPTTWGLYLGLFFIVIGTGFYSPNMVSHFGKLYSNKTKLLDSGFTIFFGATSLGALLGPAIIGFLFDEVNWNIAFIISGVFMLLSIIVPLNYSKNEEGENLNDYVFSYSKIYKILIAAALVGFFWVTYELPSNRILEVVSLFREMDMILLPTTFMSSISSVLVLPLSIFFAVFWSYYYSSQFVKLGIGLFLGVASFGILLVIPNSPTIFHFIIFLFSVLLLGISERFISPVAISLLTKNANPKYLAIFSSLLFLPMRGVSALLFLFYSDIIFQTNGPLAIGTIIMLVTALVLSYSILKNKSLRE